MNERVTALLGHSEPSSFPTLRQVLQNQNIDVSSAPNLQNASLFIRSGQLPEIVFTDTEFSDGTWEDILYIAQEAQRPVQVIVVSPYVDMNLYIEVMQRGAFDFIVPSISDSDLAYIVQGAAWKAFRQKNSPRLQAA
jgi:DNA-binding NtrC family response regulator